MARKQKRKSYDDLDNPAAATKDVVTYDYVFTPHDYGDERKPLQTLPLEKNEPAGTVVLSDPLLDELTRRGMTYLIQNTGGEGAWQLYAVNAERATKDFSTDEDAYGMRDQLVGPGKKYPNDLAFERAQGRAPLIGDESNARYLQLGEKGPIIPMEFVSNVSLDFRNRVFFRAISDFEATRQYNKLETHEMRTARGDWADPGHPRGVTLNQIKNLLITRNQDAVDVTILRPDAVIDTKASVREMTVNGKGGATIINGQNMTLNNQGANKLIFTDLGVSEIMGSNQNTEVLLSNAAVIHLRSSGPLQLFRKGDKIHLTAGGDDRLTLPENMLKTLQIGDNGRRIDAASITGTPLTIDLGKDSGLEPAAPASSPASPPSRAPAPKGGQ